MGILKKMRLYRIKTVLKYILESWQNSARAHKYSGRNRFVLFTSLLYWFYRYGFDFNDYCTFRFWNLSSAEKKSYISLRRNNVLRFRLSTPDAYDKFLDKIAFNQIFKDYVGREWMEVIPGKTKFEEISSFLENHSSAVLKPISDFGGHGVQKIKRDFFNEETYMNLPQNERFILEECIENSEPLKSIAPGSLNTIRIVTLIDKNSALHILACVLRMGNGTAVTDNYHDGGMACAIDPATGRLKGRAYGMNCTEYDVHPYSGIRFDGYKVDHFGECLKTAEKLARVIPEARYVGWDLAVTPSGIEILEGNIPPGEDITQIAAGKGLWNEILNKI